MQFSKQTFTETRIEASPAQGAAAFDRCKFVNCSLGLTCRQPQDRVKLTQISLTRCTVTRTHVGPVHFDRCLVDALKTPGHLWVCGAAFTQCTIRGDNGKILLFEEPEPTEPDSAVNALFVAENLALHGAAEWALDIAEATFVDLDIRGIPAERIRINGRDQVRVSFQKAQHEYEHGHWENEDACSYVGSALEDHAETRHDFVLTTHAKLRNYRKKMEMFAEFDRKGLLIP
jgi:hypothetical protein